MSCPQPTSSTLRAGLASAAFVDGKTTAGWSAKLVKSNLQARPDAAVAALRELVEGRLLAHPVFALATRPKAIIGPLFSRYQPRTRVRRPRRRCPDRGTAHRRLLHAVPVGPGDLRGWRARDRHAVRPGGLQAGARKPGQLSRPPHCIASRPSPVASGWRQPAGCAATCAMLPSASCCSTSRPPAAACSSARARPRRPICLPSAPPISCACGATTERQAGPSGQSARAAVLSIPLQPVCKDAP